MAEEQENDEYNNEGVSTNRFIEEVKSNPAIWDLSSSLYSNRMEKVKAWERICSKFIPNFSNLDSNEQNKKVIQLQKRWKGLRSCFNREKKRKKDQNRDSASTSRKEYQYFCQLSFLESIGEVRPTTNLPENIPKKSTKVSTSKTEEDTRTQEVPENDVPKNVPYNFEKKHEMVNDHDLNFLHSLLPHFKKVAEEYKLDLQSEILDTLKKYVNYSRQNSDLDQHSERYVYFTNNSITNSSVPNIYAASPADTYSSMDSDIKENIV